MAGASMSKAAAAAGRSSSRLAAAGFGTSGRPIAGCFLLLISLACLSISNLRHISLSSFRCRLSASSDGCRSKIEQLGKPPTMESSETAGSGDSRTAIAGRLNRAESIESVQKNHQEAAAANNESMQTDRTKNMEDSAARRRYGKQQHQSCDFSDKRSDICDLAGDVRAIGKLSTVMVFGGSSTESWRIKPYARKIDRSIMADAREVTLIASNSSAAAMGRLRCTEATAGGTAIVFSAGGYCTNFFHTFTDILIPLYLTSHGFDGDVHLLVVESREWWLDKYSSVLAGLSKHPVVAFDRDDAGVVRCFDRVIVGLRNHKELGIDPSLPPLKHTMLDFTRFLRSSYSLPRASAAAVSKPRMMIISRNRTRRIVNLGEVAAAAEKLGFEVVSAEASFRGGVSEMAKVVNSCEVIVGVHGAGLTNSVFLPANGVVVQVVPWGGLEWVAEHFFGAPAREMGLRYLEYRIAVEESSLVERFPRDHEVFRDPMKVHERGWWEVMQTFLVNQDVRIDVRRFEPVLVEALQLLRRRRR